MANNVNISLLLRTRGFTKGLANAKRQLTTFGQVSTTVGRTMQYALGGAFIAVGADAAKAAADFDLANRKLKALSGPEAAAGVEGLANTARQLGKNSIFTAAEVANLQVEMKKLGLTTRDVKELSDVTVRFATAMDTDAANAGSVLVKTLNKFKSSFEDYGTRAEAATKLSDQMANAILNSALTFDTLQSSLGYAGGEAEAAGFSFADTTAILAELANAGFEGSRAGTILRRIFINLAKTGTVDLKNAFGDLIENQQEFADLIQITGARSAGGIASIQGLKDAIEEFATANEKATGEVQGLYDANDQSLIGRLKNFRSAIQELGIVIEQTFGRSFRELISSLADFVRGIDAADVRAAGMITTMVLLGKAAKGLRTVFGNLALAVVGGGGVTGLAKSFMRLGPASVAIGAFVAGFAIMKSTMNDFKNKAAAVTVKLDDMYAAFQKANSLDDPFTAKVNSKGFESKDDYIKAADERLQNLSVALARGRDGLETDFASFTEANRKLAEKALRSGMSPFEVISKFEESQSTGIFSGANNEQRLADYKSFVNQLASTLAFERNIVDIREQMASAGTNTATTYWTEAVADTGGAAGTKVIKNLEKLKGIGFTQFIAGTKLVDESASGAATSLIEQSDAVKELLASRGLLESYNPLGLNSAVGETTDWAQQQADAALLEEQAAQLAVSFEGVGNIIGSAFQQAATGARTFGDALKNNLIAAISAVISKLIALSAAYGLAAIAKAFLDGGTSIAQGAAQITSAGFGGFLGQGMGFGSFGTQISSIRTTGYVAGSDLVLTTGRGINANDRLYG